MQLLRSGGQINWSGASGSVFLHTPTPLSVFLVCRLLIGIFRDERVSRMAEERVKGNNWIEKIARAERANITSRPNESRKIKLDHVN